MLDDTALFVHIVRCGGLAIAGDRLGMPPATVTRRLHRLETRLGCRLLHRSARSFGLTVEGESYFSAFADLVERFEATAAELDAERHNLAGPLTVTAPTNISVGYLQPMWRQFVEAHPEIRLDLRLSNRFTDLIAEKADLAMRIGPQPDSDYSQRLIGNVVAQVVAAPVYLEKAGWPQTPSDLNGHRIIAGTSTPMWPLVRAGKGAECLEVRLSASTTVDDIGLATSLAADGAGIALVPPTETADFKKSGQLIRILPDWDGPRRDIYCIWPSGRLLSARAKCLRDFMTGYLASDPIFNRR